MYDIILIFCYMEKLKISPINSILGRYFHDEVTDVNPPTYQKIEREQPLHIHECNCTNAKWWKTGI